MEVLHIWAGLPLVKVGSGSLSLTHIYFLCCLLKHHHVMFYLPKALAQESLAI